MTIECSLRGTQGWRASRLLVTPDDTVARFAKALAHPARLALLRALSAKPRCCGHLVDDLSRSKRALAQSTVSQHLNVLVDARLVTRTSCGAASTFTLNRVAFAEALGAFASLAPSLSAQSDQSNEA